MPTPEFVAKSDQLHAACNKLFEHYVSAIETDMNAYVDKNGEPMDLTYAHSDLTRILAKDIDGKMLAGIVAAAILKQIAAKGRGRG